MPDERRDPSRPSPDALLDVARREESPRGRLKVFLGAAPGVGKTYEMLTVGRARAKAGIDVVVGIVETHGRAETEALVEGLDVLPRRQIDYHGAVLEEMDLDALLARRPALALVDELAHTNAPGSRHPKRFQDVEELLDAGIDVHTTLNIQHVDSLNDVVAQITRIRVRETVPDGILDRADDIKVVDLNPDDLIQRLKDGKVYVPQNAERALLHYFSRGNLTALRELALRRTADRVDDELLSHMRANAISGPWGAGERVLVCISEDPRSHGLVRYAKRLADRLHAPWTALTVEGPRSASLGEAERDRIAEALRLADRLGGEPVTIPGGRRIAEDVLAHARASNVIHIVVGKSDRSRLFELVNGSVVHDLVRGSGNISVHVISGETVEGGSRPRRTVDTAPGSTRRSPLPYALALLATGSALGLALLLQPLLGVENADLILLTAVVAVAVRLGLGPSLAAVVSASLAYNFFFLPPLYTFTIADPTNIAAFLLFTLVAILVSNLAARSRKQAVVSQARASATERLYGFSRKLSSCGTLDDVLWATAAQVAAMLRVRVVLVLPEDGSVAVRAGYPPEDHLDEADLAAARWAFDNERPAGRGADTLPGARRLFLPMRTGRGTLGVIGLDSDASGPLLTPEGRRLIDALTDMGALAIERVRLVEDLDRAERAAETDRLRQALLTSISHDLRTPLASVLGAATTLRDLDEALPRESKADLLATIVAESERLNRFIANLLDMTRLEAGAVAPNLAQHDVAEIVATALRRMEKILADHRVVVEMAPGLPPVSLDPVLFEQVLVNLLDNAAKYAPEGTTVTIRGSREGASLRIDLLDEGEGLPEGDAERVFEKFYRARKGDRVRAGTGLGLAIARGFIEAMGGRLTAANRRERGGAVFSLTLPVSTTAQSASELAA
ncbi:sensor histidine kinase [Methylobacterium brachythecii]|uniref:histidine kinase n=1 Tax=Methylobacterium brachythecii TaxID=1176177 RepID=A0A7W6F657_9HYPH|nr:sensor histidine kinase KdpD [Methylobacterium brachythecii]MBB3902047.1 two-component system sensor histidine kinase KdpD [Methylobacterium brachythecii]GLS46503.1 two-component sensor histidine kinase [Methylobacterium brachythecii]